MIAFRVGVASVVCALTMVFAIGHRAAAQETSVTAEKADSKAAEPLAARQLEDVFVEGQTVGSLLSQLALDYDIPIGFQAAMNSDGLADFKIKYQKILLTDLFKQFVAQHDEYTWEIKDEVVYVFPKDALRDWVVERLLNVEIGTFVLPKNTCTWDVEAALFKTPEFKAVADAYGLQQYGINFTGFYIPQLGRNYSPNISNANVRTILDRIIKESPTAIFWSIRRTADNAINIRLSARHEDTPRNFRLRKLDDAGEPIDPVWP